MADPYEIERLKAEIRDLNAKVVQLDKNLKDVQQYVNELLRRAGIKGGFPV